MNSIKKWIRDVFGFSGNEINGFLILIPILLLLIISEPIYSSLIANHRNEYLHDAAKLDSLTARWHIHPADSSKTFLKTKPVPFNPNTASPEQLQTLGFSRISANRIAAYRQKGGTFKIKSDLNKIYGLDSALYKKLYNYIQLPSEGPRGNRSRSFQESGFKSLKRKPLQETFDINTADTTLFKTVYGIGSTLAARIVKFRDGLGGFIKVDQLYEVYGLDSLVVSRLLEVGFIGEGFVPIKININTAPEKDLATHPYIRYKIARALVTHRFQHGSFTDVGDIKQVSIINPEAVERFLPYIKLKD